MTLAGVTVIRLFMMAEERASYVLGCWPHISHLILLKAYSIGFKKGELGGRKRNLNLFLAKVAIWVVNVRV